MEAFATVTSCSQYFMSPTRCVYTCSDNSLVGTSINARVTCLEGSSDDAPYIPVNARQLSDHGEMHTHSFSIQDLLHDRYAVRRGLAAPSPGAREDVTVLKGERDCLGLDECRTGKAQVGESAEDARIEDMGEGGEGCLAVGQAWVGCHGV